MFAKNVAYVKNETNIDIHSLKDESSNHIAGLVSRQCHHSCRPVDNQCNAHTIAELSTLRDGLNHTILNNTEINELLINLCIS